MGENIRIENKKGYYLLIRPINCRIDTTIGDEVKGITGY